MAPRDSGLTFDTLAARLEALEAESHALRAEMAEMRAAAAHAFVPPGNAPLERMSRRWVLRRAMQATAATLAAGVLVQRDRHEAVASHSDETLYVGAVVAHLLHSTSDGDVHAIFGETSSGGSGAIVGDNLGSGPGVRGTNASTGPAVEGIAYGSGGTGVKGTGRYGVWGESTQAGFDGVFGRNTAGNGVRGVGSPGVRGTSSTGIGVWGDGPNGVYGTSTSAGSGAVYGKHNGDGFGVAGESDAVGRAGVLGRNSAADGVRGEGVNGVKGTSTTGIGVWGEGLNGVYGSSTTTASGAVYGRHFGNGYGVAGETNSASRSGVLGRNTLGDGVTGEGRIGVRGTSTHSAGYAGQFQGGKAQLRIVPSGAVGRPTTGTHSKGELYVDKNASIWICTIGGTPGTWKKVQTS
jgi:hypothetical protein